MLLYLYAKCVVEKHFISFKNVNLVWKLKWISYEWNWSRKTFVIRQEMSESRQPSILSWIYQSTNRFLFPKAKFFTITLLLRLNDTSPFLKVCFFIAFLSSNLFAQMSQVPLLTNSTINVILSSCKSSNSLFLYMP